MKKTHVLMDRLMYGTGMRLMKCIRLLANEVDFGRRESSSGMDKGRKDRVNGRYSPRRGTAAHANVFQIVFVQLHSYGISIL